MAFSIPLSLSVPLCLSVSLCLSLSLSLSCLSVSLSLSFSLLSLCVSLCLPLCLSLPPPPSLSLSLFLSLSLSRSLYVCLALSVSLYVFLFVCLSLPLPHCLSLSHTDIELMSRMSYRRHIFFLLPRSMENRISRSTPRDRVLRSRLSRTAVFRCSALLGPGTAVGTGQMVTGLYSRHLEGHIVSPRSRVTCHQ